MPNSIRERPEEPGSMYSHLELIRFVGMMVHDLGHRVSMIRSWVDYLRREPSLRSGRGRETLDNLARAADDLAYGLRIMRSIGSDHDKVSCDFLADVMQPGASFAERGRGRARLLVGPSVRQAPRVRLRLGPAVLAITRLISRYQPDTIRCLAIHSNQTVIFTMELSRESDTGGYSHDGDLEKMLHEAGVLIIRFSPSDGGRRLAASLEIEVDR